MFRYILPVLNALVNTDLISKSNPKKSVTKFPKALNLETAGKRLNISEVFCNAVPFILAQGLVCACSCRVKDKRLSHLPKVWDSSLYVLFSKKHSKECCVQDFSCSAQRDIFCWVLQGPEAMLHILDCHLLAFALLTTYIIFSSEYLPNSFPGAEEFTQAGAAGIWRFVQGELRNLLRTVLKGNKNYVLNQHLYSKKNSCWRKRMWPILCILYADYIQKEPFDRSMFYYHLHITWQLKQQIIVSG